MKTIARRTLLTGLCALTLAGAAAPASADTASRIHKATDLARRGAGAAKKGAGMVREGLGAAKKGAGMVREGLGAAKQAEKAVKSVWNKLF